MNVIEEWRVSWTMWPFGQSEPSHGERITQDEDDARDQLKGLRSMLAPHDLRPCDVHVWGPRLEHRTIEMGPWVPVTEPEHDPDRRANLELRALLRGAALGRQGVCVCAVKSRVIWDSRQTTPYTIAGCVVGIPVPDDLGKMGFTLEGYGFRTYVLWTDLRDAWLRDNAPEPCPHCGKTDEEEQHD